MIYFTSDVHLASPYHKDPRLVERRLVSFLDYAGRDATAIYFLGDMIDLWYEYRDVVPRGFVRFFGKVAELTDKGVEIHFIVGNHDLWTLDYFEKELGASVHHKAIEVNLYGKLFRLSHGDEECRSENWKNKLMYGLFRNRLARILFSAIHPRWSVGFARSCSYRSRIKGEKKKEKYPHETRNPYFHLEDEHMVKWTKEKAKERPDIDFFLFGHRHLLFDFALSSTQRLVVLGDWYKGGTYIQWDGKELLLEEFEGDFKPSESN